MKQALGVALVVTIAVILLVFRPSPSGNAFKAAAPNAVSPALLSSPSKTVSHVLAGSLRLAEISNGILFTHSDAVQSTAAQTGPGGQISMRQEYLPFGASLGGSGEARLGFAGKEADDSGARYFGARSYVPPTGRFLQVDPLLSPYSANYAFTRNNPMKFVDPTGSQEGIVPELRFSPPIIDFGHKDTSSLARWKASYLNYILHHPTTRGIQNRYEGAGFDITPVAISPDTIDLYPQRIFCTEQECADVQIGEHAWWLKSLGEDDRIAFRTSAGDTLRWADWRDREMARWGEDQRFPEFEVFLGYLRQVFTLTDSWSLKRDLPAVEPSNLRSGDILIEHRGGDTYHAMGVKSFFRAEDGTQMIRLFYGDRPAEDPKIVDWRLDDVMHNIKSGNWAARRFEYTVPTAVDTSGAGRN